MPVFPTLRKEAAPSAGLPLVASDLLGRGDLAAAAARHIGVQRLQLESSAAAALIVALKTLHRLSGRRAVVVPAYTSPQIAIAVAQCGLELRICDLAPDSLDLDLTQLASLCDADTLAVVPTHLAGRVTAVAPAIAVARSVGAFVIEDASHAFGAVSAAGAVGAIGDLGFFSLGVGDGLSIFEGGLLWAHDDALRKELALTSAQIVAPDPEAERRLIVQLLCYWALYNPRGLALVYGSPRRRALAAGDVASAVGDVFPLRTPMHRVGRWRSGVGARAISRLAKFQAEAAERARTRLSALAAIPGATVFYDRPQEAGVWPFFLVLAPHASACETALARLWPSGLGVSRLYRSALPDYDFLKTIAPPAETPNAQALAARALTVTNSDMLDDAGFARIVAVLKRSFA